MANALQSSRLVGAFVLPPDLSLRVPLDSDACRSGPVDCYAWTRLLWVDDGDAAYRVT